MVSGVGNPKVEWVIHGLVEWPKKSGVGNNVSFWSGQKLIGVGNIDGFWSGQKPLGVAKKKRWSG